MLSSILSLFFLLFFAACNTLPQGKAEDGERWFKMQRCSGCHGEDGKGPRIAGTTISFRRFLKKLRTPDSAIMPTFPTERLSDQDAADIYLWLQENK